MLLTGEYGKPASVENTHNHTEFAGSPNSVQSVTARLKQGQAGDESSGTLGRTGSKESLGTGQGIMATMGRRPGKFTLKIEPKVKRVLKKGILVLTYCCGKLNESRYKYM